MIPIPNTETVTFVYNTKENELWAFGVSQTKLCCSTSQKNSWVIPILISYAWVTSGFIFFLTKACMSVGVICELKRAGLYPLKEAQAVHTLLHKPSIYTPHPTETYSAYVCAGFNITICRPSANTVGEGLHRSWEHFVHLFHIQTWWWSMNAACQLAFISNFGMANYQVVVFTVNQKRFCLYTWFSYKLLEPDLKSSLFEVWLSKYPSGCFLRV